MSLTDSSDLWPDFVPLFHDTRITEMSDLDKPSYFDWSGAERNILCHDNVLSLANLAITALTIRGVN